MRRLVSALLLVLGAFLVVAALLIPTYAAPALVKVPLDQYTQSISEAKGATVFRIKKLEEESGVDLQAIRTVRGDVHQGNTDRAVFDVFLYIKDSAGTEVSYSRDRVALDRRTAEAVACCGEYVNGKSVKHQGLSYKFPFDTQKKTYDYFDITALKSYPIRFLDTDEINGLEVYKFQMTVDPVKIGDQDLPGKLLGTTAATEPAERFYANTRTIWVEPETGVIIKGREEQKQTFRNAAGEDKVTLIDADIEFTEETIANGVKTAEDTKAKIALLNSTLPWTLGGVGALLLIVGIVLTITSRPTVAKIAGRRRAGATPVSA
jgi:hypothetical protein